MDDSRGSARWSARRPGGSRATIPTRALELGIGQARPAQGAFDGGVVDLNNAPALRDRAPPGRRRRARRPDRETCARRSTASRRSRTSAHVLDLPAPDRRPGIRQRRRRPPARNETWTEVSAAALSRARPWTAVRRSCRPSSAPGQISLHRPDGRGPPAMDQDRRRPAYLDGRQIAAVVEAAPEPRPRRARADGASAWAESCTGSSSSRRAENRLEVIDRFSGTRGRTADTGSLRTRGYPAPDGCGRHFTGAPAGGARRQRGRRRVPRLGAGRATRRRPARRREPRARSRRAAASSRRGCRRAPGDDYRFVARRRRAAGPTRARAGSPRACAARRACSTPRAFAWTAEAGTASRSTSS